MKIPVYDNQVGAPNPPQFNNIADVRSETFAQIADGLDNYRIERQRQLEEERKTEYFKADSAIRYELKDAHSKMLDAIQNGGSYANAEQEYQKKYDEILSKYSPTFEDDANMYERSMAEYKLVGLSDTVQLRNAVQARRKRDATISTDMRVSQYTDDALRGMINNDVSAIEAAMNNVSAVYAGGVASGVFTDDQAKIKIAEKRSELNGTHVSIIAEQDPRLAKEKLQSMYEGNQIKPQDYLAQLGAVNKKIDALGSVEEVLNYQADPLSNKAPSQESVDVFFNEKILSPLSKNEIDPTEFENRAIDSIRLTNKVPTQIANKAKSFLNVYTDGMSDAQIKETVSMSRIVSKAYEQFPSSFTKDGKGLNENDVATANLIFSRIEAGMDQRTAVETVLKSTTNPEFKTSYKKIRDEVAYDGDRYNSFRGEVVSGLGINEESWPMVQTKAQDLYANAVASGASPSEATDNVVKLLRDQYGTFDGVTVRYPPTKVTNIQDEKPWLELAQKEFNNFYKENFPNMVKSDTATNVVGKPVLFGDEQTIREKAAGKQPSFLLGYDAGGGSIVPLFKPDGTRKRVAAIPNDDQSVIRPLYANKFFAIGGPAKPSNMSNEEYMKKWKAGVQMERNRKAGKLE